MQSKSQLTNTNETWNAKKRYKINAVVTYLGKTYQNSTGKNSEPGDGSDWYLFNPLGISGTDDILNESSVAGINTTDALNNIYTPILPLNIVYVQTTGNNLTAQVGNISRPFLTIDAALDALPAGGGVIKIGIGSFSSPDKTKIKSNTAFIGSKEPIINSTVTISTPNTRPTISSPTALINGTILTGEFLALDKSNITVENLGIDVGKTWVDTFNGGVPVSGLVISSVTATAPIKNITVNNVAVLGYSATTSQHCMLFENIVDCKFSNLTTYYNVHGVVIKGLSVNVDGISAHSHKNDGLIIKSDIYAPTRDISVNNVNISSLSGYEGGGIILEEGVNGSSLLERVSLNNVNLKYVKFGLNNVNKVSSVNISNFNLYDSNAFGIKFDNNVDKINLSGINIVKTTTDGIDVSITGTEVVNIVNSSVSDATGIGYKLTTAGNALINLVNSNTLNTPNSYLVSGGGIYGSSNFGTGTKTGYIKFNNSFVRSEGRIFSTNDANFGDLGSTNGTLDFNFSNSAQKGTIESYNFTTALFKPLEIKSSTLIMSALIGTGTRNVVADSNGILSATDIATDKPYKVYVATLGQITTGAPSVSLLLENTLGSIVWTRTSTGVYKGTLTGAFVNNKTICFISYGGTYGSVSTDQSISLSRDSNNNEVLLTQTKSGSYADDFQASVEIRVYN